MTWQKIFGSLFSLRMWCVCCMRKQKIYSLQKNKFWNYGKKFNSFQFIVWKFSVLSIKLCHFHKKSIVVLYGQSSVSSKKYSPPLFKFVSCFLWISSVLSIKFCHLPYYCFSPIKYCPLSREFISCYLWKSSILSMKPCPIPYLYFSLMKYCPLSCEFFLCFLKILQIFYEDNV